MSDVLETYQAAHTALLRAIGAVFDAQMKPIDERPDNLDMEMRLIVMQIAKANFDSAFGNVIASYERNQIGR